MQIIDSSNNHYNPAPRFVVRECTRESCGLRFTMQMGDSRGARCPICRSATRSMGADFGRASVQPGIGWSTENRAAGEPYEPQLEVLLDNIRSAWNVGSMLRSSDGAGVRHVHLCGVSAPADNPKVAKTALGAEKSMPWTFHPNGVHAAGELKSTGLRLWALEGGERAESLFDIAEEIPGGPIVLAVGNELSGVDPGILELCERVVCLPMQGIKGSLNVAVAFGIAVYFIRFGTK